MKSILVAILIGVALVGGTITITYMAGPDSASQPASADTVSNVTMEDGVQVVTISAKGGYAPERSIAKAGVETVIRFTTSGTFDCSAALRIPSLDLSQMLPPSGVTEIPIGISIAGPFKGSCGMGMYPFEVIFE